MRCKECPGHLVWHFLLFKADYFGEEPQAMTVCMGDENTTRTTVLVISGVKFGWPLKQSQHGYFNCRREGVLPFMSLLDAWLTQCSNFQDGDRESLCSLTHFSILLHLSLCFIKSSLGKCSKMTPAATQEKAKLPRQYT